MAFRMWVFTDGRLGHLNQLKGLVARVADRIDTESFYWDINAEPFRHLGRRGLIRQFASSGLPDVIIGAGSACHWPLLWARMMTGRPNVVLMKPNWPLWLYSAACVPAHDAPRARKNILVSQGVLNNIRPVVAGRQLGRGLILLGGLNRHFDWHSEAVVEQVLAIVRDAPDVQWLLSDSPRTPEDCLPMLVAAELPNLQVLPFRDSGSGWLKQQLEQVGRVWVSCDSVSMVYESVTSGAPTGLVALPKRRDSRVARSMASVMDAGLAQPWQGPGTRLPPPAERLWEADRAAQWLLARLGVKEKA